jgi:general secretion pathway protein K
MPPTTMLTMRGQRGFALLIVLWTLVLLTLLGSQIVARGRGEARLASNLRAAAIAEAAADGAIEVATFHLLDGSSDHWLPDGALHLVRFPSAVVEVRIADEAGKVNPNLASEALLQTLLTHVGADGRAAAAVAAAITDWRSPGDNPRALGAKAAPYAAAGRDYGPPGAPFKSIDELGEVLGMTPELLQRLRPHLSLFARRDPVLSAADPVVVMALRDAGAGTVKPAVAGQLEVAAVTVLAQGPAGARVARQAVIRLGGTPGGEAGDRPWKVLTWTRAEE